MLVSMEYLLVATVIQAVTLHPYPEERFARHHPRQEPGAVVPLAGICAGGPR